MLRTAALGLLGTVFAFAVLNVLIWVGVDFCTGFFKLLGLTFVTCLMLFGLSRQLLHPDHALTVLLFAALGTAGAALLLSPGLALLVPYAC